MIWYIRSMNEDRNKIYDRLTDKADQLVNHLIKLLLYPTSDSAYHWKLEVYSYVHSVSRIKTNRYPDKYFIRDCLGIYNDTIWDRIRVIQKDYGAVKITSDDAKRIKRKICAYQHWLSSQLSINGMVAKTDVLKILDNLILNRR